MRAEPVDGDSFGGSRLRVGLALVLVAAGLYVAGARSRADAASSVPHQSDPVDAEINEIYQADCAVCHGSRGEGTLRGPSLIEAGAASVHYYLTTGRMPIDDPEAEIERSAPSYPPEVVEGLIALVADFAPGGMPVPEVDVASGDVPNGGELYRLLCAACHHASGSGGALIDRESPPLREATAVQVVEAVRTGPGQMPVFGQAALSDDDAVDVAAYVVEVLHDPEDRGGIPIWHLGPVPEGAVAIVIGLGLLILVSVWIEGRAGRTWFDASQPDEDAREPDL